jgi:putative ABC transport system permease protein
MRSALTMLGIIIGVGAVIAMVAVGTGASQKISEQISSMGSNLLIILPGATTSGGVRMGAGTQPTLSLGDAEAIQKECTAVSDVAPIHNGVGQVVYGHTSPGIMMVREWELTAGRAFTQQDVKSATKVALLGQTVVDNLFGDQNPVGQTIRIKNVPFTVIGVLAKKGQSAQGQDQDDTILIPVTTAQKKLFGAQFPGMVRVIMVKAKSAGDLDLAEQQMLVSVTERTREIGIRMAIGAKTWDIRLQFIIEALTLSLIGGIIGIIAGVSTSVILSNISGWPTVVSPVSVVLAFGFSGFIGIFFGFYPAYKASLLNPIDALRYE